MLTPAAEAGSWNPDATISTRNGQCKSRTRSSSASGSHARACLSQKNRGPPPNRWMSVYEAVTLPPCPHTKPNTTARNCKDGAYPAQTLSYVELMGFPDVLRISRDIPICGMITSRLSAAGPSSTRPSGHQPQTSSPALQARPQRKPADRARQADPVPGRGGPSAEAVSHWTGPEPAEIMVPLVRTGSARQRNPLVPGGPQRSRPASRNRRPDTTHRYDLGRRRKLSLGSNPSPKLPRACGPCQRGGSSPRTGLAPHAR
jgi:hypothetical protein